MSGATTPQSGGLADFVIALDNAKTMRVGENDHPEYDWNSNDLQEQLVQIFFQAVRTPDFAARYKLMARFHKWIADVLTPAFSRTQTTPERRADALALALHGYKMIAHLRDAEAGKGECRLAYDLLYGWYTGVQKASHNAAASNSAYYEEWLGGLAYSTTYALAKRFMFSEGDSTQYGSFKDFKYLCHEFALLHLASDKDSSPTNVYHQFVKFSPGSYIGKDGKIVRSSRCGKETFRFTEPIMSYLQLHPVLATLSSVYGEQILNDYRTITKANEQSPSQQPSLPSRPISLAGKWAPRASSKLFAPLRQLIMRHVVPESEVWKQTAMEKNNKDSIKKAELKIDTVYRQRLSAINKALNTVQVKQCEKNWASIDFDKHVTSITLARQKKAFAKTEDGDKDREQCASNFAAFMERVKAGTSTAKGKKVAVGDFVHEALNLNRKFSILRNHDSAPQDSLVNEKALLDGQWDDKGTTISKLGDCIAMVDVSGSMYDDYSYPLRTAIGLGIRIAEKSRLGNRVMTFSERPAWVDLSGKPSFTDRVGKVSDADWGMSTNFYAAFQLILDAVVTAKLTPEDVGKLTLVILSDMQMNVADMPSSSSSLFSNIANSFTEQGLKTCGAPYPVPKVVFWNLRKTNGFPTASTDPNSVMVSGGSDALLNDLCEKGLKSFSEINPWNSFVEIISKERYASLDSVFAEFTG
jgi:hypothetical protein